MSMIESAIVFLPRPTTLVGATSFITAPLDVSRFGSMQLQLWRGPIRGGGNYLAYFEESLDTETWALGPATPIGYDPADSATGGDPTFAKPQLFSYAFRLRWFRMRFVLASAGGTAPSGPIVTTYAEGLLRDGGGGGAWGAPPMARGGAAAISSGAMSNINSIGGPNAKPTTMAEYYREMMAGNLQAGAVGQNILEKSSAGTKLLGG